MTPTQRTSLTALLFALGLTLVAACKPTEDKPNPVEAEKKGLEAAAAVLKQPVASIAVYLPYVKVPEDTTKYAPKRRNDASKVMALASEEVRQAANLARQKIDGSGPAKEIITAMEGAGAPCTNVEEETGADKCLAAVQKIEDSIKKVEAASAASGSNVKLPHIVPESITPEAKAQVAPFLRAKGPGPAEKAYATKRGDTALAVADLMSACQAAADETGTVSAAFEKADEPLRLVAVTHKIALEAQCRALTSTDSLHHDLTDCRKKAKSTECKIVCGKSKALLEEGLPAAAFASMEKDVADICKD